VCVCVSVFVALFHLVLQHQSTFQHAHTREHLVPTARARRLEGVKELGNLLRRGPGVLAVRCGRGNLRQVFGWLVVVLLDIGLSLEKIFLASHVPAS
jgi:hypothetical protein